ncbi:MAG: tetratricopeptide repeat protein [Acetobacteraceae bacterium]
MASRIWAAALPLALSGWLAACAAPGGDRANGAGMNGETRLRVAEAAEGSGDRDLAVSMYTMAANEAPSDAALQLRCAEGLARNGKLDEAGTLLKRRLRESGRRPDLLGALGSIQVLAGQPAQAEATFSEVLASRPDDVRALVNKGVALDLLRRHNEAQDLYRKALALAPRDPAISNDLALSLLLSGRIEEARQALAPFRDDASLPARIRINLGILEAARGNGAEAQRLLEGSLTPTDLAMLTHAIETGGGTR